MKILNFLIILNLFVVFACKKESYYSGNDVQLRFSKDTVLFDTVFSGFGTATQRLMVYNPYNESVNITNIRLANGTNSPYIININGSETEANNVVISPNDSMYVFVQVRVMPNGSDLPVTIKDSLLFITNGSQQDVKLITYAQDVNLLKDSTIGTQTWNGTKPYLIDGTLIVDSAQTLYINSGVKVYMGRNANIIIKGNLQAIGNFYEPVVFRHNRFEKLYNDIPGQWGGIYIMPGVGSHRLEWVVIQNGTVGLQVGDLEYNSTVTIDMSNVIIRDMAYSCLIASRVNLFASNCLFANAKFYTCYFIGGSYQFYHSTIANYYSSVGYDSRKNNTPGFYLANYFLNENSQEPTEYVPVENSFFRNCIVYGEYQNEFKLDFKQESPSDIVFDNCIIRKVNTNEYPDKFTSVKWNTDPKFIVISKFFNDTYYTFELDTLSAAKDAGALEWGAVVPYDLNNKSRMSDIKPDFGAFERYEK